MNISFKNTKFEVDFMKNLLNRLGFEDKNYQVEISMGYPDGCFFFNIYHKKNKIYSFRIKNFREFVDKTKFFDNINSENTDFIDKTDYFIQNGLLSDLFFEFMTKYPKYIVY